MAMVRFKTPGLLDIRSITIMGMNAKPNTVNPIGYFGTGLKYAIATLCRLKIPITIWIGNEGYSFYTKTVDFRSKEFEQIWMRKGKRSWFTQWFGDVELPFTTEYGKNWELWMAFRELESNTRDEKGTTSVLYEEAEGCELPVASDETNIYVESDAFADVYVKELDEIFLPRALNYPELGTPSIQVFNQPSKHVYYRGLRVYTPKIPTMYTYNLLGQQELTEDRTLKWPHSVFGDIARYVATNAPESMVAAIANLKDTDTEKFFEAKLDFDYAYATPSQTFMEVIRKKKARGHAIPSFIGGYYSRYAPPPPPKPVATYSIIEQLAWWVNSGEIDGHVGLVDVLRAAIKEIETLRDNKGEGDGARATSDDDLERSAVF